MKKPYDHTRIDTFHFASSVPMLCSPLLANLIINCSGEGHYLDLPTVRPKNRPLPSIVSTTGRHSETGVTDSLSCTQLALTMPFGKLGSAWSSRFHSPLA
eukprot:g45766.t1